MTVEEAPQAVERAAGWETTLVSHPGPGDARAGATRHYRLAVDGHRLLRAAWAEGGRRRESVTVCADVAGARDEFLRLRRRKLREGFVRLGDAATAARGAVVLGTQVPDRCAARAFDLSPDGRTLVVGTVLKGAYGARLYLVDVATGRRRLLHSEPPDGGQTFVHAVFFDASGGRVGYALNGETRLLDMASGESRTVAAYREFRDARFNPFTARPSWDAARRRLLVFDAGGLARILGPDGEEVFATSADRPSSACWTGALSPSGRLVALCFHRRAGAPAEEGAEVEVWDVERGAVAHRLRLDRRPHTVGFDPSETLLLVNPEPVRGPCAYALGTGERVWHFPDPHRPDRMAACYGWAYAPDGSALAVGRFGAAELVDAATRRPDPAVAHRPGDLATGRTSTLRFSADGTLLAAGGDTGLLVVRRV